MLRLRLSMTNWRTMFMERTEGGEENAWSGQIGLDVLNSYES